jgi:hypothetical protein
VEKLINENIQFLAQGGQNDIFWEPELGRVYRVPRELGTESLCIPTKPLDEAPKWQEFCNALIENGSDVKLPQLYRYTSHYLEVAFIEGSAPRPEEVRMLLPHLLQTFKNMIKVSALDWHQTTLDLVCPFTEGIPVRTSNFIRHPTDGIFLVDPFFNSPDAMHLQEVTQMVIS